MNKFSLLLILLILPFAHPAMAENKTAGVLQEYDIQSIHVVPMEPVPTTQMYYRGPGNLSVFGAAVAGLVGTRGAEQGIKETAQRNDIHIDKIVTEEVQQALEQSHKITVAADESPNSYQFSLAIYQFGFSAPNGFSSKLVPVLTLECQIKSVEGKRIWKDRFHVLPLGNPVSGITPDDLVQDPKRIEGAWRDVAKYVANKCVKAL